MTDSKTPEWIEAASGDLALDYVDWLGRDKVDPDAEHVLSVSISQALLSAYERGRVEREWQPIETAPKDRSPIVIAVPTKDRDDFIVGEAYFDPEHYDGEWWWAGTGHGDYHGGPISEINHHMPTHWMPLPAPPAIRQLLEVKG